MNDKEISQIINKLDKKTKWDDIVKCVEMIVDASQNKTINVAEEIGLRKLIISNTTLIAREYKEISSDFIAKINEVKTKKKEETDRAKHEEDEKKRKEIEKKADKILKTKDPLNFLKMIAHQFHVGDDRLITGLICSIACQSIANTDGIQPKLSGASGKGKSHCCKIIGHLIASSRFIETTVSSKALFYMDDLQTGTTILCDDTEISEELGGIIKRSTTNYQTGITHTVVVRNKQVTMTVPARLNWWLTSVSDNQGVEILNRQFQFDVDESERQDDEVIVHQGKEAVSGRKHLYVDDNVLVCREIFKKIAEQEVYVKVEFARRIIWGDKSNRRSFPKFLDLVRAFTILNYQQREKNDDGVLIADVKDFELAKRLYVARAKHQKYKLNDSDFKIIETIVKYGYKPHKDSKIYEISTSELQKKLGISQSGLHQKMHGQRDMPESGLLSKYKNLQSELRSETVNSKKSSTTRVNKRYYILTKIDYTKTKKQWDDTIRLSDEQFNPDE